MVMTRVWILAIVVIGGAGCSRQQAQEYELTGQILGVDASRQEVTIRHEDIPRFMPGMTMAFKVREPNLLEGRTPGDLVTATLVVSEADVHLRTLTRTGFAPVVDPLPVPLPIEPGDLPADAAFFDESGTPRRLADWRGHVLAVTFTYTRCPLPDFCPLIDRHFQTAQQRIGADAGLRGRVRLLSVSVDPAHDTPDVLAAHAAAVKADPEVWRFLTGQPDEMRAFAAQFGVSILGGSGQDGEVVHNLRTAVIDPQGRLATVLGGSDWTPDDLVAAVGRVASN